MQNEYIISTSPTSRLSRSLYGSTGDTKTTISPIDAFLIHSDVPKYLRMTMRSPEGHIVGIIEGPVD